MNQVGVAVRSGGKVRVAHVHKAMLNAFQAMTWYTENRSAHLLDALLDGESFPLAPYDYGLVAIDRDTRWAGTAQGYLNLAEFGVITDAPMATAALGFDLERELRQVEITGWPQLFSSPWVRTHLLAQAHQAGAVRRMRVERWADESAPWQSLSELGLTTLPKAVTWANTQRRHLEDDKPMSAHAVFEFAPAGWTLVDHGGDLDGQTKLLADLRDRGFAPSVH